MVGACIHMTQGHVRRAVHQGIMVQPSQHMGAGQGAVRRPAEVPRHRGSDVVRSVRCDVAGQV